MTITISRMYFTMNGSKTFQIFRFRQLNANVPTFLDVYPRTSIKLDLFYEILFEDLSGPRRFSKYTRRELPTVALEIPRRF